MKKQLPDQFNPRAALEARPWFEETLAAIAPSWALKRAQARVERHLFEYNAAKSDRIFAPKTHGSASESSQTSRDRQTMMWEARDLFENFPFARPLVKTFSLGVAPTEYAPMTGDPAYDRQLADWFHAWCKRCDITGRHSLRKLVQLAVENRAIDGDFGFIIRRNGRNGLLLQAVGADRIGEKYAAPHQDNYYSGVTVDDLGRPVSFRIISYSKEGVERSKEEVAAKDFIHYLDPFRVDQYRGVSDFHAVIQTSRMLSDILKAEMAGVKFSSQQAALIYNERGVAPRGNLFNDGTTLPNGNQQQQEYTDIGTIRYLQRGDSVQTMPARPSSAFTGFVEELKHEIAIGLGYPSAVVFTTADYTGPAVRAEFARADRVDQTHRGTLEDKVLCRIKDVVILDAIARGELPLPSKGTGEDVSGTLERALRGCWRYPAKRTIDVGRESDANINEVRAGLKSPQEIAAEQNADAFERIEQTAQLARHVADMAEKYDVPESVIRLPLAQAPMTVAAAATVGEKTGEDAAAAQASSTIKPTDGTMPTDPAADPSSQDPSADPSSDPNADPEDNTPLSAAIARGRSNARQLLASLKPLWTLKVGAANDEQRN